MTYIYKCYDHVVDHFVYFNIYNDQVYLCEQCMHVIIILYVVYIVQKI